MTRKSLIISTPDTASLQRTAQLIPGNLSSWIYLGQDIMEQARAQRVLGAQAKYINTSKRIPVIAEYLRGAYLTEIYRSGRELGSLQWWVSSVAYRNSIRSATFIQTCLLRIGLDIVADWSSSEPLVLVAPKSICLALVANLHHTPEIQVSVAHQSNPWAFRYMSDFAKMLIHRTFFIARESYRIFQARKSLKGNPKITGPTTLLLSWATPENIHLGAEFHKSYFGPLVQRIEESGEPVAIAPIVVRSLALSSAMTGVQCSPRPILIPHRYLSYLDVLRAAGATIRRLPNPPFASSFCGMDIRSITNEDLRLHWIGNTSADAQLIPPLVRRWKKLKFPIKKFIYIYENQPLERALCWEIRKSYPEAKIVGYQHSRVPRFLLNFHLAPDGETEAPLPDKIVTVGDLTARTMLENGYAADGIQVGGALHLEGALPLEKENQAAVTCQGRPMVLFAPGDSPMETTEMCHIAMDIFKKTDNIQVIIKCHSQMPFKNVASLTDADLADHVTISHDPISDLIARCSLMVYSGSSVVVQALASGVPVIHLSPQFDVGLDPMEFVPYLRIGASDLDELRQKTQWLLEHREEYIAQNKLEWAKFVNDMYKPVTEETTLAFVD